MPELPEVETIARGVDKRIRGDRVVHVWFDHHPQPFKTPRARQAKGLTGRTILAVHRTGKHIVFELSLSGSTPVAHTPDAHQSDAQWIVHLGMTGRLLVTTPESPVALHTHARLTLASGRELRFVDPRRFGRLELRDLRRRAAFDAPGDEPLTIGEREFAALFHTRRLCIKAALLNQKLLTGVGNIYADESLFHAGIRPRRRANRVTRAEFDRLRIALREILTHAIRLGGSSVSD
ncbi:MAG: DNA-formamidopyrimidine glycosylase family protein, partial [Terracidiphilus sp.]